jgi:hypothetical protein
MELTIRPSKRGWCKPTKGAQYASVSPKVFYGWLRDGLRHVRLANGRILTQFDWIDAYLEKFEVTDTEIHPQDKVEQVVGAIKQKMRKGHGNAKKTNRGDPVSAGTGMDHKKGGLSTGT